MANVKKEDRVQDVDIKRLNHVGIGLKAIAELLGCHPATVTIRLKEMGIEPTDTRRSFMEKVFSALPREVQDWLSTNLYNNDIPVHTFVTELVLEAYRASPVAQPAAPAPLPPMDPVPGIPMPPPSVLDGIRSGMSSQSTNPLALVPAERVFDSPEEAAPASLAGTKSLFGG